LGEIGDMHIERNGGEFGFLKTRSIERECTRVCNKKTREIMEES
jgi:hypothetical protein